MKKVAPKIEKYVTEKTFEKAMTSIAKSFDRVDDQFSKIDKTLLAILNETKTIQQDNRQFRNIENLLVRVGKLEAKVK